jgi:hypothetical protein
MFPNVQLVAGKAPKPVMGWEMCWCYCLSDFLLLESWRNNLHQQWWYPILHWQCSRCLHVCR